MASMKPIAGLYEANRNHAPVILIATQIVRQDLGFELIQEIDFDDVFKGCSVYCEMILTPEQARKTVAACQAALTKRGVAVLVVPADIANAASHEEPRMRFMHALRSFARATRASTRSQPFSTRVKRSRSMRALAAQGRMTRWSPRRRG